MALTAAEKAAAEKAAAEKAAAEAEKKPVEISGNTMKNLTIKERAELLSANGIETKEPEQGFESSLPDSGEIIDIVPQEYNIEGTKRKSLVILSKDTSGKIHVCSKGKISGLFLERTESRDFPHLAEIGSDSKGNITLFNRKRLNDVSSNNAELFDLIGKKFKATKVDIFGVPFQQKFESKTEALNKVKISQVYKLSFVD